MVFAQAGNDNNRGQVGGTPTPADMFHELPIITKVWLGATIILTLSVNFNIVSIGHAVWSWDRVKSDLEVYRFLTPFCYGGKFSLNLLFLVFMQCSFSQKYEQGMPFNTGGGGSVADYAFCWLLGAGMCLVSYPLMIMFLNVQLMPIFYPNMTYYVLYIWSKKNPDNQSNIWGFPVKGLYLPFAYLAITVLMDGDYRPQLHGICMGHFYYFCAEVCPIVYGRDFLATPNFLIDYFGSKWGPDGAPLEGTAAPSERPRRGGFGNNNTASSNSNSNSSSSSTNTGGGHQWGSGGNRLGAN